MYMSATSTNQWSARPMERRPRARTNGVHVPVRRSQSSLACPLLLCRDLDGNWRPCPPPRPHHSAAAVPPLYGARPRSAVSKSGRDRQDPPHLRRNPAAAAHRRCGEHGRAAHRSPSRSPANDSAQPPRQRSSYLPHAFLYSVKSQASNREDAEFMQLHLTPTLSGIVTKNSREHGLFIVSGGPHG